MDRVTVLTHILQPDGRSTLLGGQRPASVISNNKYISPLTSEALVADTEMDSSLDQAIRTGLTGQRTVILVGPEGSGKTTTLLKVAVDWARGEDFQNFSSVFHLGLREMKSLEGLLSLETFMSNHHVPLESMPVVLQKPEAVLFILDDLDHLNLDPAAHTFCSDPSQATSVSCLLASLLHGFLLRGAAFLLATRSAGCLQFLSGSQVHMSGFLKPQREAFTRGFFTDQAVAAEALTHMERTLGFYDVCASPRFCWMTCSMYKFLIEAGAKLPETLSQLCVDILVHLLQTHSLEAAPLRDLVLALGRTASHCSLARHSSCTKEEMDSFGFQPSATSQAAVGVYLHIDGDPESDGVFSFHSQLMQEFILAVSFFLSPVEGLEKMLEKHEDRMKFLDLFLSALSGRSQRGLLETLLGDFNPDQILDFKRWFKSSSKATLKGCYKDKHHRCFHLLHQAQNESLVREIITPSARLGISYGDLSLRDCVALSYVVSCLGGMEQLNLYHTRDLTEEQAEVLAPAMSLSQKIV